MLKFLSTCQHKIKLDQTLVEKCTYYSTILCYILGQTLSTGSARKTSNILLAECSFVIWTYMELQYYENEKAHNNSNSTVTVMKASKNLHTYSMDTINLFHGKLVYNKKSLLHMHTVVE